MKPNLKLKCLICIVNHELENSLVECLRENNVRGINTALGHSASRFHLLEFEHTLRFVVISFIKFENEENILQMLVKQGLVGNRNGIAFTIDVDAAAGGNSIFSFYDKLKKHFKEKGFGEVQKEIKANKDNAVDDAKILNPGESENEDRKDKGN